MTRVKINKRLEMVALKVDENSHVLDVGCDHALLCIYLTLERQNVKTVASDIKEGPIERAKENIKKYGLEKEIETRIGPGIETIDDSIDTVVISGMGGLNMIGILKYKNHLLKKVDTIVLSPNNYFKEVREQVSRLGYYLKDEDLVEDKDIIYPVMVFKKGKKHYKKREYVYSPILIKKQDELFRKYLISQQKSKSNILKVMPKKYFMRRLELKMEVREIEKLLIDLYN